MEIFAFFSPARLSCCSINLALFRGKLLWNNLPRTVQESVSVKDLKQKFKHIQTIHCFCIYVEDFEIFVDYASISFCLVDFYYSCNYCLANIK